MRLTLAVLAAAAVFGTALPLGAQAGRSTPPPVTFGSEIEVVNLNVSVTNNVNQFVTGLKGPDFAIFEDGIRQELTYFNHEDLPISLVLVIDGSASMSEKVKDVQSAAQRFIQTLRPGDVAQVVQFSDRVSVLQAFTGDHTQLEAAILQTDAGGPTALHNALYVSLKDLANEKRKSGGLLRRRAVVLLSDGEDTSSLVTDDQVLDLARKTEINIYPIMLRANRLGGNRPAFSQAEYLLNTLARETGGQAFSPNSISELDKIYDRIAEELRTLYSMGYVSSNPRKDGKWRRIVLRIPSQPDVQVRNKLGYYAPK